MSLSLLAGALVIIVVVLVPLLMVRRGRVLRYTILLRFPLIVGLLGSLLPLVHHTPLVILFDNLYVLERPSEALFVGAATAWLIASQWYTGKLIFLAIDERVGVPFDSERPLGPPGANCRDNEDWLERLLASEGRPGSPAKAAVRVRWLMDGIVFALFSLPMIIVLGERCGAEYSLVAALGYVLVCVALALGWRLRHHRLFLWLGRPVKLLVRLAPLWWIECALRRWPKLRARYRKFLYRTRERRQGYGYRVDAGHGFALLGLLVSAVLYVCAGVLLVPWRGGALVEAVPSLAYLLVILTITGLVLPGLSFFLDFFRFPTLVLLFGVWLVVRLATGGDDHFYRVHPQSEPERFRDPLTINERRYADEQQPVLVVVVASGGGAQAAVWTSHVLAGITTARDDEGHAWGRALMESVGLVSTVSGGSVGAMYWVDSYVEGRLPSDAEIERLHARIEESTLEPMAWGLAFPDLSSSLVPTLRWLFPTVDRGYAIERSWASRFGSGRSPKLSEWAQGVGLGERPLHVFNATAIESGCRVLIGSSDLRVPALAERRGQGRPALRLDDRDDDAGGLWLPGAIVYPVHELDLDVTTAARLSATFPYVLPAARMPPELSEELSSGARASDCEALSLAGQHLVDGGYYDNYGVVTAMQWLDRVLQADRLQPLPKFERVVVIEIRATTDATERSGEPLAGWVIEAFGPLLAMLSVRNASQLDRNSWDVGFFADAWCGAGVDVRAFRFEPYEIARLSWSLTPDTLAQLDAAWTDPRNQARLADLHDFVHGPTRCRAEPPINP